MQRGKVDYVIAVKEEEEANWRRTGPTGSTEVCAPGPKSGDGRRDGEEEGRTEGCATTPRRCGLKTAERKRRWSKPEEEKDSSDKEGQFQRRESG